MAEAVGLVVGFAGLAGLFSTCVDCFKLVQVYDNRYRDYEILQTMLDNQQFHFMAWGKACGFMDPDRLDSRFEPKSSGDSERNKRIETTMEKVQSLLTNGDNLKEKYGLKVQRASVGSKLIEGPAISAFSKVFQSTKTFWNTSLQRKSNISGTVYWAINDKDKFERLIQNLRDLLDDLNKFTQAIGVSDSRRLVIEYELEMIDDEPSLEAITAASACDDDDDLVSHTASRRLSRVKKAQSEANQSVGFDDSVSMASMERYTPSISTIVEEEMEGVIQEIGITRVPLVQWRKVKTRAGIVPWLKVLVVAVGISDTPFNAPDDIQPLSRTNTFDLKLEGADSDDEGFQAAKDSGKERALRLAINSRNLINILRKITKYKFSTDHNVLVYPFKPLLVYGSELRLYLRHLQAQLSLQTKEVPTKKDIKDGESVIHPQDDGSESPEMEKTKRTIDEMECLIEFMDNDMHDLFDARRQLESGRRNEITFENLWLLFQPGCIAVSSDLGGDNEHNIRAYQILHVTGGRPIIDIENHSKTAEGVEFLDSLDGFAVMSTREYTEFRIGCYSIEFDGTMYGPQPHVFTIAEFSGVRSIQTLPLRPIQDFESAQLLERGKKFRHCVESGRYLYSGIALQEWDDNHRDTCSSCGRNIGPDTVDSEVIIDHAMAIEHCRGSGCNWSIRFGGGVIAKPTRANKREVFETVDCSIPHCKTCTDVFDDAVIDLHLRDRFIRSSRNLKTLRGKSLTDNQLILLPYRVCGYSLNARKWYPLSISQLSAAEVNHQGLDNLVLPASHRTMLSALMKGQIGNQLMRDDGTSLGLIRGKGRGTLILLHGAPGTGKTATAEGFAASLDKPLFSLRVADFGSTSREMGQNLTQYLKLVERWGCILLINDADVIVAQRSRDDREGSNITAVFIDALEYFTGILILTTNRVGIFDEALRSRIHLSLYYPPLDLEATLQLWRYRLDQIQNRHDDSIKVNEYEIIEFAREHWSSERHDRWNGRQIQNAIDTALALAREDAKQCGSSLVRLELKHFKAVTESSMEFGQYLMKLGGMASYEREGVDLQLRNNTYKPTSSKPREYTRPTSITRQGLRSMDYDDEEVSDDDLEVQELEIKLQMAKLKRKQKELEAKQTQRQRRPRRQVYEKDDSI